MLMIVIYSCLHLRDWVLRLPRFVLHFLTIWKPYHNYFIPNNPLQFYYKPNIICQPKNDYLFIINTYSFTAINKWVHLSSVRINAWMSICHLTLQKCWLIYSCWHWNDFNLLKLNYHSIIRKLSLFINKHTLFSQNQRMLFNKQN